MTIKQKDKNRAELVQAIIRQNGGRIFTVVAKRKSPKVYFTVNQNTVLLNGELSLAFTEGEKYYLDTKKMQATMAALIEAFPDRVSQHEENFMEMTCRTGVKSQLKGGTSTIKDKPELISVNLTNGKGYRCFSAYNVLELRAGGTNIRFKEEDVLAFQE